LMTAYYGPLVAATQSVTPPNLRALSQAVLLLAFNLFGLGLGPLVAGLLSDALGAYYYGSDGLRYALVISLIPSALSALLFFYAGRSYADDVAAFAQPGAGDARVQG